MKLTAMTLVTFLALHDLGLLFYGFGVGQYWSASMMLLALIASSVGLIGFLVTISPYSKF